MREIKSVPKDADLASLVNELEPFLITGHSGQDLGMCLEEWTPSKLKEVLKDCRVSVHVSREQSLNFVLRNFEYQFMTIAEMLDRIARSRETGEFLYYRSLGTRPRKDPATLVSVHPYLEETFQVPQNIANLIGDSHFSVHSTVFRISQVGIELWTHYDALDNFLVQVRGEKNVLLFPPSSLHKLKIVDTSSPFQGVCHGHPDLDYKDAIKAKLLPGDVLFIPAAWSHSVYSVPEDSQGDICISVNTFLSRSDVQYTSKNVYGNEDPPPMRKACDALNGEFLKLCQQLPRNLQDAFWSKIASIALSKLE
ncbi:hypothetical protein BEWA_022090 [Theileria equi strain WA]|uniref:JmjC domain-containing protein n=1 Tax=Theileria equi strain WA TaxID=1537102 RepID=L0AWF4_THEEQ|nr:hypothetical protein BEWA_022090 [Theileria equi strain WA]AFZ79361.1 hypothetical protein BEWA_022090 [Theileria equi strain WA]|eukprot:XP_004829027.1 hypothetical protein BEWA_022090 [Theileria equi strain WA]